MRRAATSEPEVWDTSPISRAGGSIPPLNGYFIRRAARQSGSPSDSLVGLQLCHKDAAESRKKSQKMRVKIRRRRRKCRRRASEHAFQRRALERGIWFLECSGRRLIPTCRDFRSTLREPTRRRFTLRNRRPIFPSACRWIWRGRILPSACDPLIPPTPAGRCRRRVGRI